MEMDEYSVYRLIIIMLLGWGNLIVVSYDKIKNSNRYVPDNNHPESNDIKER